MTNYNNEKEPRLRGSMAPKTDEDVALAGTNSSDTQNKPEALAGEMAGGEKEPAQSGAKAVEEETTHTSLKDEAKKVIKEIEEKFDSKK